MNTRERWRRWLIQSKNPLNVDMLSDVFLNYSVDIQEMRCAYVSLPSEWMLPERLHALIEQDGMEKIIIVRGPQSYNHVNKVFSMERLKAIYRTSQRIYPQKLVHVYEEVSQFLDEQYYVDHLKDFMEDKELIQTLNAYCECDLNVTLSAEKLFVHRNTMLYRLEKIYEQTGFNLKRFSEVANLYYSIKKLAPDYKL